MTLQIELNPELEARLAAQATQQGMATEAYVLKLVEDASAARAYTSGTGRLTREEFEEMTRELTRGSENLPILPPEATDRESFYEDRW